MKKSTNNNNIMSSRNTTSSNTTPSPSSSDNNQPSTSTTTTTTSTSTATPIDKCIYCFNNLGSISIVCAKCNDLNLCLKCFSMSAEIGEHKKEHNYRIRSKQTNYPIFDKEQLWTHQEESHLLTYIELYGFGNWDEIAKLFDNKTPQQCMQHYYAYYIYGNIGKYTFNEQKISNDHQLHQQHPQIDVQTKENGSEITVLLPPIEMSSEEQRGLGYMPLRDDFEREYKNDCESLISNLVIYSEDEQADIDFKITLSKMYRDILIERQRYKRIARDYGLINNASALINKHRQTENNLNSNNQNNINTNMTLTSSTQATTTTMSSSIICNYDDFNSNDSFKTQQTKQRNKQQQQLKQSADQQAHRPIHLEDNELNEKYKKLTQFCSVSTYETLLDSLRKRDNIQKRLNELNKYREYGLTKYKEIEEYNKERIKRDQQQQQQLKSKKSNQNSNKRTSSSQPPIISQSPLKRIKTDIITSDNDFNNLSCASSSSGSSSSGGGGGGGGDNSSTTSTSTIADSNYSSSNGSINHNNYLNISTRTNTANGQRMERLCSMPGYNLLSDNEKKLISSLNMKPNVYITFKTFLIKNNLNRRQQLRSSSNCGENGGSMMLRRHSTSSSQLSAQATATSTNGTNCSTKLSNYTNTQLTNNLINSYPNYCKISKTTRKRIVRFLCDNGWIDVS